MNTEKLCVEFEKIFGPYKSDWIRRCQRVLSGDKGMISSPYPNFLCEIRMYFKVRISNIKQLFSKNCEYLYSLCDPIYRRFRRRFRKKCAKSGLATYNAVTYIRSAYPDIPMLIDEFLRRIFSEASMTFEYLLYETVMLNVELSIQRKLDKRNRELICKKTKDLL